MSGRIYTTSPRILLMDKERHKIIWDGKGGPHNHLRSWTRRSYSNCTRTMKFSCQPPSVQMEGWAHVHQFLFCTIVTKPYSFPLSRPYSAVMYEPAMQRPCSVGVLPQAIFTWKKKNLDNNTSTGTHTPPPLLRNTQSNNWD